MEIKIVALEKINRYTGEPFPVLPEKCPSTHGGAGYCTGSYFREDGYIVCALCGAVLTPCKWGIGPHVFGRRPDK